jgi:hypothetical protein
MKLVSSLLSSVLALALVGCVTHIEPSTSKNPAPAERLDAYQRFELQPLQAATPQVAEQSDAMARIQESINARLGERLAQLNQKPVEGEARTLVITPIITELKFVNGAKRAFGGSMAGSSAVILKAKVVDKATGKSVAFPEFFARAAAMGGAYSMGGSDNAMLQRIGNSLAVYILTNYRNAVGGPVEPTNQEASSIKTD